MSNWYKPHLKSVYNAQDKTFVSRLNRLRFFHDRRVLKFLRWKKGDLGRRLRGIHSLRWYKMRYRFGLKFYNFSSKKRRKLRVFRQNNLYKVGLDRKKNFLSFYRKFDESKIRIWFKEYYNKSRQYKVANFFRLFETRLDVLCFRMKLLPTIFLANMFIKNTGILVNYSLVREPGKRVAIGDLISFENSLQWSFFSSRFTEQLWKRWHRFKELNIQRKKTRLLVFREYYKKTFNIKSLDKKSQSTSQFSTLENNWNFFLNKASTSIKQKKIKEMKKQSFFNNTFWFLNSLMNMKASKKNNILTKYFKLLTVLTKTNLKLNFSNRKIINLILTQYVAQRTTNTLDNKDNFNSLVIFYKHYFNFLVKKKKTFKTNNYLEMGILFKDFIQHLKTRDKNIRLNKNFILLSNLYCQNITFLNKSYKKKRKNNLKFTRNSLFENYELKKIKNHSGLQNNKRFINDFKENSLKRGIGFWIKNLLPFLRFNFSLKNLTEVLFLQFFSNKASYSFFFLKFWLSYRKFLLNFSKIFTPLSKFFSYIKLFKNLVNIFKAKTISYSWFWKSFYSRLFIQKLNILINFKNSFNTGSNNLITFFNLLKNFLNPSIYLQNQRLLTNSLYKANLILESSFFNKKALEHVEQSDFSEISLFKTFNGIFSSNILLKLSSQLDKKGEEHFKTLFDKYLKDKNKDNFYISLKKCFYDYLNFIYLNITKNFHESFIVEKLVEKNNLDYKNVFFKQKNINLSQKQFINLALANSLNTLNFSTSKNYSNSSEDIFFNSFKTKNLKDKGLEHQGYLNHKVKEKVFSKLDINSYPKKKHIKTSFLPLSWLSSSNKNLVKILLTRNIKKSNLNTRLLKSISIISSKSTSLKKKRLIWKKNSILPVFKRYKKDWKSKYWSSSQIHFLKNNLLQKALQKKFVSSLKLNDYKEKGETFSSIKNSSLKKVINRFYVRKVLSQNLYSNLFYSKNTQLLTFNNLQPYNMIKSHKKKKNKLYFGENNIEKNILVLRESLRVIFTKVNFSLNVTNKKYHLTFLRKQVTLWKNSIINFLVHIDRKPKQKIKVFTQIRKLVKKIKMLFSISIRISNNSILLSSSLNSLNDHFKKLFGLIGSISSKKKILRKKIIKKPWLKFRLKLRRNLKNTFFKSRVAKESFINNKLGTKREFENKLIFLKENINKPFRKTQNFIKRSKKRRKNYKLGQRQTNQRWLRKQKKRFCDINLNKWSKLKIIKRKASFDSTIWFQSDNLYLKNIFLKKIKKDFSKVAFFEKFILLETNTQNISSLINNRFTKTKKSFLLKNVKTYAEDQKRNALFFINLSKQNSKKLDFIKLKRTKRTQLINNKRFFTEPYKNNYNFLFKINTLRRYKSLISYHQKWNRNSTVRLRYKMRSKLLKLNKIRRLRKKKFFNIRSKPLLLLPSFLEFDFVTFRSYVISTPNLEASLYGGATNSYFYSFLSFYQRLGL